MKICISRVVCFRLFQVIFRDILLWMTSPYPIQRDNDHANDCEPAYDPAGYGADISVASTASGVGDIGGGGRHAWCGCSYRREWCRGCEGVAVTSPSTIVINGTCLSYKICQPYGRASSAGDNAYHLSLLRWLEMV
jgi:hypothetical protein